MARGQYNDAITVLQRALAIVKVVRGTNPEDLGEIKHNTVSKKAPGAFMAMIRASDAYRVWCLAACYQRNAGLAWFSWLDLSGSIPYGNHDTFLNVLYFVSSVSTTLLWFIPMLLADLMCL